MEMNKQRHLKGNWLAYWEHEIGTYQEVNFEFNFAIQFLCNRHNTVTVILSFVGLSERETAFNFKQIKLQTFSGKLQTKMGIISWICENK